MISISLVCRIWWRQWRRTWRLSWLLLLYWQWQWSSTVSSTEVLHVPFGCPIWKEMKRKRKRRSEWTHTDWGSKRDSTFLLRSGFSCYCEGPRHPVALTRGWPLAPALPQGPWGRPSSDDNTCPYYVYITLMLTCNLSAVAAWRHSLCVCTEVATCEFVQYMQVCVCLCPRRNLSVVTQKSNTCMHPPTTAQYTHTPHIHTQTHASSCSPFSTLSWALPVTPHGDFALCQLSYSNKPLRHSSLRCHHWFQCVCLPKLIYIIYL